MLTTGDQTFQDSVTPIFSNILVSLTQAKFKTTIAALGTLILRACYDPSHAANQRLVSQMYGIASLAQLSASIIPKPKP